MYDRDHKRLQTRQMNTLIGISKGIISDGVVNQKEAEFLLNWLYVNEATIAENPTLHDFTILMEFMLEDGRLDANEAENLKDVLQRHFAGETPAEGELMKPVLPLDDPQPPVVFEGRSFLVTGKTNHDRSELYNAVIILGGNVLNRVTRKLDYLVIGPYASALWKGETWGNKIETAIKYKAKYGRPTIISEDHFMGELGEEE